MNKQIQTNKDNLTKEDKLLLLKNFLVDEIYVKAIIDTFTDEELDKYINENLDTLLLKQI